MKKSVKYGTIKGPYKQKTVKERIKALFFDNIGKTVTREQIIEVATDPVSGKQPENWHQRLSELRTDDGYTILSWRNRGDLKVQEYLMPNKKKRIGAARRTKPTSAAWLQVLERAGFKCEWSEEGIICGLKEGDVDPVGGGRVKLTPDHKLPHSIDPNSDPADITRWLALCGRHQVIKKNYWDSSTGKLNAYAIVQAATRKEKLVVFQFLLDHFGYEMGDGGTIHKRK